MRGMSFGVNCCAYTDKQHVLIFPDIIFKTVTYKISHKVGDLFQRHVTIVRIK